jgi:Domain of unknown function (DUF4082)/Bacterial Ig-like domain/Bacterial Ig domain
MTQGFQRFTNSYVNILGVLIGLAVVGSILLYSGCGMMSRPNIPTDPAPTPTPTPDNVRPTSIITSPIAGGIVSTSATVNVTGTASDAGGGSVQSVQVSVDGGVTWNLATGTSAWSYAWSPALTGPATIKSRALDTSGNQQDPPAEVTVTVQDVAQPTSTIWAPITGATLVAGTTVGINGTASDAGGGSVAKVEVSVNGGATWNMATGTSTWSYNWTPTTLGPATVKSRAVDTSGNVQDPPAEITVTVADPPPTVTSFSPPSGTVNVSVETNVVVTFSEAMDPATVNDSTVVLLSTGGVSAAVSYDEASRAATLDPIEPLVAGVPYTIQVKTGNAGVKDLAGNAMLSSEASFFTTAPAPPQIVSTTPERDANNVPTGVALGATFSEALRLENVNASTVQLTDAANNPVPVTISYAPISFTIAIAPQAPLQPAQTYTVTLKGGAAAPRITDWAFTPLASDYTWSFTTAAAPSATTFTIWEPPNDTPDDTVFEEDDAAVELGLKFRSDRDGIITGVRFYKGGPENGGTHVGNLWTSTGTLLSSVTFTDEAESGWQQASFPTPVPIEANTTYVVSYFAPQGNYAITSNYFPSPFQDNPPLHALGEGNGVLFYGSTGGFPTEPSPNSVNYWVDVVFVETPPQVLSTTPAPGATGISYSVASTATFSEALDPASVNASTVLLIDAANNQVPVDISYDASAFMVTLTPQQLLQPGQAYTVTFKGGPAALHITDLAGTPLASDYVWSFITAPLPSPNPILVITTTGNKFTEYYQEILRAEGFGNFGAIDITHVTKWTLFPRVSQASPYQVIILGEMPLTPAQVTALSNWVQAGGRLIAMRPDKQLASLLGISDAASVLSDAYLLVDTSRDPGTGIVNQTIQYRGPADLYMLASDTQQVAAIYSGPDPTHVTSNPAVTLRQLGVRSGKAAAFTFDLARSIVYTRQGNPAWVGQDRDGIPPIRPNDLFFGGTDPDYVNLDKVEIPQADELQRLFANMILSMNETNHPLPRFWYLPSMKKAVIVMAGDDRGTPDGTQTTFDRLLAQSPPGCSVENWECYRATSWLFRSSGLTDALALDYHNQGFDLGAHVTTNCENWTPETLSSFFADDLASFAAKYTSLPAQKTNRTNCTPWSDWATHPKVEFNHGIRLDMNYYYYPGSWVRNRPGFMTGSGFPMRYADTDGSIIDVYQAATDLVNETDNTTNSINSLLDKALGPEGYYGVFGARYDYTDGFDARLLDSARARAVSLISAQQLLTWLDGRNSSSFGNRTMDLGRLTFRITVGAGANNLYVMIPNQFFSERVTSITIQGSPVPFTVETIKGRSYAVFPAANGFATVRYGNF